MAQKAKSPWMKFFPQDWRSDEQLRLCSLAARGLWIEMLAIMHRSERYGQLLIGGRVPTDAQLAVQVGAPPDQVSPLVAELEEAGVFSRTATGAIYSRRMTRDHKKAETARKTGKTGGNPNLLKDGKDSENSASDNPPLNPTVNGGLNTHMPEARSQRVNTSSSGALTPAARDQVDRPRPEPERRPAQQPKPQPPPGRNRFDAALDACNDALGQHRLVDPNIGPIVRLVDGGFRLEDICAALAEMAPKRRKPVKAWTLWATLVQERLTAGPPSHPSGDPDLVGYDPFAHRKQLPDDVWRGAMAAWVARRDWHEASLGYPPGHALCSVPAHIIDEFRPPRAAE